MKKITLEISNVLDRIIEKAVLNDGFHSRSEFLRFLIIDYSRGNKMNYQENEHEALQDKDEEVDLEFGIPPHIVKEIEVEARRKLGLTES